jgi:hypothetical protein
MGLPEYKKPAEQPCHERVRLDEEKFISVCLQQRQQTTLAVQGHQIIATTHMGFTNEDLGHGASPCEGHHALALGGLQVNTDLFYIGHTTRLQQLLGANAKGANGGGEHLDWRHDFQTAG